jgi:CubicO group peptidase (beta-lactamase class C family)
LTPAYTAALALLLTCAQVLSFAACSKRAANAQIDSVFHSFASHNLPGVAVLVRRNGRNVFEHGYGVRDLRTFADVDAETNFRLASLSKQFTAMAIMLLERDGKLHYEEKLTDLFPGFPAYGRTITVRNLLTHTSGLPDYEDLMEQVEKEKGAIWSPTRQIHDREVLNLLELQSHGKFAPGTGWSYSNSGYIVLGLIASEVSGEPFAQFLRDRIFGPLHMMGTVAYVNGKNRVPRRAYGYTKDGDRFIEKDQSATSATLGDGGIYSNLADLAKWDDALQHHTLVSDEQMRQALTPVVLNDGSQPHWPSTPGDDNLNPGEPVSYGFGWFLDSYDNHKRMWHWGSTSGFRTAIERFSDENTTIVILCNRTDVDPIKLALRASDVILPKK